MQLLRRIGLEEKAQEYPDRLSGGQQQRVAIVRALAMEPQLLLLDEITSALDPELVAEVLNIVRQLAEEGMTMVIATHEMGFAREVATKVCFLHEGVVHEEGPPEQVFGDPQRGAHAGVPAAHHRGRPALRGRCPRLAIAAAQASQGGAVVGHVVDGRILARGTRKWRRPAIGFGSHGLSVATLPEDRCARDDHGGHREADEEGHDRDPHLDLHLAVGRDCQYPDDAGHGDGDDHDRETAHDGW